MLVNMTWLQSEIRASELNNALILEGLAVPYGKRSEKLYGMFYEEFQKYAFSSSMDSDVFCYYNHNRDRVLGRTKSGTLQLREDDDGVHCIITLPEHCKDIYDSVKRGDISGMSVGFYDDISRWTSSDYRIVESAKLLEISVTPEPAYKDTEVNARNVAYFNAYLAEVRKRELEMREKEIK